MEASTLLLEAAAISTAATQVLLSEATKGQAPTRVHRCTPDLAEVQQADDRPELRHSVTYLRARARARAHALICTALHDGLIYMARRQATLRCA